MNPGDSTIGTRLKSVIWLTIIAVAASVAVLLLQNLRCRRQLIDVKDDHNLAQASADSLQVVLRRAQLELANRPGLYSWHIIELRRKGLADPVHDIVTDLMHHSELIPYEGVLGGTMSFYSEDTIHVLTTRWVLASFEDGHIGGNMLLEYRVSSDGEITWSVIDSYLD
jgi:hypothetical protein